MKELQILAEKQFFSLHVLTSIIVLPRKHLFILKMNLHALPENFLS